MRFNPFLRPLSEVNSVPSAPAEPNRDAALWQSLLQTTEDAILLTDSTGRVLVSNVVAARLFTIAEDGYLPSDTLLTQTLSSELDDVFQEAVRRQAAVEAEVALSKPTSRSVHARITPVADGEFLLVLRDLTELRRLERVRRDFVANVSHELRTPLTSIKAMAETLIDGARLDESVAERFLETIIHESDRLVRLSSDLLDLSRVEVRGPNKNLLDMAPLIAEVTARFTPHAQNAEIRLVNLVQSPLMVMADRDEMAQVLVNLVDNAISYTPRGGSVTITGIDRTDTIMVSVADTGIGILSHDIPRLFERFYRADKARSRASGGTGLGLSIVKHIVENHGGTVGVVSEYNRGSEFSFTLPK
jgi:two-component system phosphate regulon sensor histidine kinase PhoR